MLRCMYLLVFPNRDYAVGALAGVVASAAAIFAAHPIESVKVRLQSGERGGSLDAPWWRRVAELLRRPYCGIGPHLLQYSALNSIRFGSFAAAKGFFERRQAACSPGAVLLPLHETFLCGAFSGGCIAALLHPLWFVKTHQQANRLGVVEAGRRIWNAEGVRGFFRGYVSGFARFPIALGIFFASYEALKHPELLVGSDRSGKAGAALDDTKQQAAHVDKTPAAGTGGERIMQMLGRAGAGATAGVLCWTSIYPLDVVQSRMLGEAAFGQNRVYSSALTSFVKIYRTDGLRGFTRGYSAVLMRAGPINAVLFPVNDAAQPLVDSMLPPASA